TFTNVFRLDKIPLDPLTDKEYTYSLVNTGQEYEIAGMMEGDDIVLYNQLSTQSNAGDRIASTKVTGNYNGKIAKVFTTGQTYVLAVPTIISGSGITIEDIMANQTFVYTGYNNLPFSYNGSLYNTLGEVGGLPLVDPSSYVVYSGSIENLTGTDPQYRLDMLEALQIAYSGTLITDNSVINEILAITDFTDTNTDAVNLASILINTTLGGSIVVASTSSSSSSSGGGACVFGTSVFGDCTF
ncbi:MAG: hypothetical protein QM490_01210, partial [Candidatus Gracilibacteria bacterium]